MDKNAFLLHRAKMMAAKKDVITQPAECTQPVNVVSTVNQSDAANQKYNPDVMKKFTEINQPKNRKLNVEYVHEYYKTVTGQPLKKITDIKDLQLEKDVPDIKKSTNDYNESLHNRSLEKEIVKRSIYEFRKKNNINVKTVEEMDREYQEKLKIKETTKGKINTVSKMTNEPQYEGQSHFTLKDEYEKYAYEETDKMMEQKQRYNNILKSLSEII